MDLAKHDEVLETPVETPAAARGGGMRPLVRSGLLFTAIGLAFYAALFAGAEWLLYRTGRANPLFKIATAPAAEYDWVILGASHAMPLDFGDANAQLERASGQRIINLAAQGTGPLYQRFVLEEFLRSHRARGVAYVADSFAFQSATWNEERFADAKLQRRTPFSLATALHLWRYVMSEGIDPRAWLDYVTGFSKINNRERWQRDAWEGEAQFGRVYRTSRTAVEKRIKYLYPAAPEPAQVERYMGELGELIDVARRAGMNVTVIRMPVPADYQRRLPDEATFETALDSVTSARGASVKDFSRALPEARYYFDTDHLNNAGVAQFTRDLAPHFSLSLERGPGRG